MTRCGASARSGEIEFDIPDRIHANVHSSAHTAAGLVAAGPRARTVVVQLGGTETQAWRSGWESPVRRARAESQSKTTRRRPPAW